MSLPKPSLERYGRVGAPRSPRVAVNHGEWNRRDRGVALSKPPGSRNYARMSFNQSNTLACPLVPRIDEVDEIRRVHSFRSVTRSLQIRASSAAQITRNNTRTMPSLGSPNAARPAHDSKFYIMSSSLQLDVASEEGFVWTSLPRKAFGLGTT